MNGSGWLWRPRFHARLVAQVALCAPGIERTQQVAQLEAKGIDSSKVAWARLGWESSIATVTPVEFSLPNGHHPPGVI